MLKQKPRMVVAEYSHQFHILGSYALTIIVRYEAPWFYWTYRSELAVPPTQSVMPPARPSIRPLVPFRTYPALGVAGPSHAIRKKKKRPIPLSAALPRPSFS
ncbi:hypothetical protein ACH5RR_001460 [Cinchona calisaya]|uniref:Uncharacterized protein n=1 Tax=Cinchona calisaya TaxID=153742 RepID=A0ABD3B3K1_9GENT